MPSIMEIHLIIVIDFIGFHYKAYYTIFSMILYYIRVAHCSIDCKKDQKKMIIFTGVEE